MSEETNLALIKDVTDKWVNGKYDDILPHVADDAEYQIARGSMAKLSPLFGHFKGKAQIKKWYDSNRQVKKQSGIQPFCRPGNLGKFMATGDQVVSYGSLPAGGGAPTSDWVAIWTVKQDMISQCWLVMDTATTFVKMKKVNPRLKLG
jgi:hypothetical protein